MQDKINLICENEDFFRSCFGGVFEEISFVGDYAVCDGKIALPIYDLSPRYKANDLIEIKFKDFHTINNCAYIFSVKGVDYRFSNASAYEALVFFEDFCTSDMHLINSDTYQFKCDYLIIDLVFYESWYRSLYKRTSHLWGGFSHNNQIIDNSIDEFYSSEVIAVQIDVKTEYQQLEFKKYNKEFSPIYRFLSLYHIFELVFDYDLVQDIKSIGEDYKLIGKKIAEFKNNEFDRLVRIFSKINDESSLNFALKNFFSPSIHKDEIYTMLFDYEKSGFPWMYKDQPQKLALFKIEAEAGFDKNRFNTAKLNWSLSDLQKAIAFIIYRFRCAIAHASIGEYVISVQEEKMVFDKGIPLIVEMINIVFKK